MNAIHSISSCLRVVSFAVSSLTLAVLIGCVAPQQQGIQGHRSPAQKTRTIAHPALETPGNPNIIGPARLAPRILKDTDAVARYLAAFPFEAYKVHIVPQVGSFYLDDIDDVIKNVLRRGKPWETQIRKLLFKHVRPGSTVLDVGAHIGTHTITIGHLLGPRGRVYAFEPQKKIFRELHQNLALNGVKNAVPLRFAVGSKPAIIEMGAVYVNSGRPMNEGGVRVGVGGDKAELRTIDSFGFTNISLIKIDVEGFEDFVLDGARATIRANQPVIIAELMGGNNIDTASPAIKQKINHTLSKLRGIGYSVKRIGYHDYLATPLKPPVRPGAEARHHKARITLVDPPRVLKVGEELRLRARVANTGSLTLLLEEANPIYLSYHWLDGARRMLINDGVRTLLPRPIGPGDAAIVDVRVEPPPRPGKYILVVDLVSEGKYWFEQKGSEVATCSIIVVSSLVRHPSAPN